VYEAEAAGVTYRIIGSPGLVHGRRIFRAYRLVEPEGLTTRQHPAGEGGEHRTRKAAIAQAEADLVEVLADRAQRAADDFAERETPGPAVVEAAAGMPPLAELRARRASNVNALRTVAKLLDVPLDELADLPPATDPALEDNVPELVERIERRAKYVALRAVLAQLDGWIGTAEHNCVANEHGGASYHDDGRTCGKVFDVADFREMINGAADDLRVPRPYRQGAGDGES
jgi:hypothetical protein